MWSFLDYRYRLVAEIEALEADADALPPLEAHQRTMLMLQARGVRLALAIYDEMSK